MKSFRVYLTAALIAALTTWLMHSIMMGDVKPEAQKESSYEHVIRTGIFRCGYGSWEPGVYKNFETNKMEGIFVELAEAMAAIGHFQIDWVGEVDWGQIPEAIASNKIDGFCAGMAADGMRGKALAYTTPLSFWEFHVVVRADDPRFADQASLDKESLNDPSLTMAYVEGDVLASIANLEFPKAQKITLPLLSTPAEQFTYLLSKKTDFVVFPRVAFQNFQKQYPGQLKYLDVTPTLRSYGNVIAIGAGEFSLQQLLNASIHEMTQSSTYEDIMRRYEKDYPGAFLPVAKPYRVE